MFLIIMLAVAHLAELPYIFGTIDNPSYAKELSSLMIDYWVSFATSLDPNDGKGLRRTPLLMVVSTPHLT